MKKRARWNIDDQLLIVEAREHQKYRWVTIAEMLPNKSPAQCENAYYRFRNLYPDFDLELESWALTTEAA